MSLSVPQEQFLRHGDLPHRSPLLHPGWSYVEKADYYTFERADVDLLHRQHDAFDAERRAAVVLGLLVAGKNEPSYGYQINNYRHSLQSATKLLRAGFDEEHVVVGLLHDVGFLACPERHGAFSAELLGGYVSERNYWMLRHHQMFAAFELVDEPIPPLGSRTWERWREHEHFEWTYEFVRGFDVNAMDPNYQAEELEFFEPMVQRIFSRVPKPPVLDD